jgi:hypothetical protein
MITSFLSNADRRAIRSLGNRLDNSRMSPTSWLAAMMSNLPLKMRAALADAVRVAVLPREPRIRQADGHRCLASGYVVCPACRSDQTFIVRLGSLLGFGQSADIVCAGSVPVGESDAPDVAVEVVFSCEMCDAEFVLRLQDEDGACRVEVDIIESDEGG